MHSVDTLSDIKKLYDERFNNLVIYSVGIGVSYEQAKDIVQESFIKLWENHRSISTPTPYLFTLVRNSSINFLKSRRTQKMVSMEDAHHVHLTQQEVDDAIEYFHKVEEAYLKLASLQGRCLDVFVMVYLEKRKIKDVAQELEISENTVKTYLKRGKEILKVVSVAVAYILPKII